MSITRRALRFFPIFPPYSPGGSFLKIPSISLNGSSFFGFLPGAALSVPASLRFLTILNGMPHSLSAARLGASPLSARQAIHETDH
jgi:hypothetical protein